MPADTTTTHVTVTIDTSPWQRFGDHYAEAFHRHLLVEFTKVCVYALRIIQSYAPMGEHNYMIDWSSKPPQIVKVPGGTLRRALTFAISDDLELIRAQFGVPSDSPAAKYARMAELGGTITAVRAAFLLFSPDGKAIVRARTVHRDPHPYLMPGLLFAWPQFLLVPQRAHAAAVAEINLL